MVLLERNQHGDPVAGLLWEGKLEVVLFLMHHGEQYQLGNVFCPSTITTVLVLVRTRHHDGWEARILGTDVEHSFGRSNPSVETCV